MSMTRTSAPVLAGGMAMVALLVGCSDSSELTRISADVAALRRHVESLESGQVDLSARLKQRERQQGTSPDREAAPADARLVSDGPRSVGSKEAAVTNGVSPLPDDPAAQAAELRNFTDQLSRALTTESGRETLAAAVRDFQARQETERRQRMATAAIAVFAEKAGLARGQTDELNNIFLDSATEIRSVWANMGESPGVGDTDAGKRIQENIARTLELRNAANEKVKRLLSPDQFEKFEVQASELHNMVSGPRPR